jgi:hypothetical protein
LKHHAKLGIQMFHATFAFLLDLAREETAWNNMLEVRTTSIFIALVARFTVVEPDRCSRSTWD